MQDKPNPILINIERFIPEHEKVWDNFVLNSYNGTFVSTRHFLNYHPKERFKDHSLIFKKGRAIVAVMPACEIEENEKKIFFSHRGSTFGGLIIGADFFNVSYIHNLVFSLDSYVIKNGFAEIILKQTPRVFAKESTDTLDFMLGIHGFQKYGELSFVIPVNEISANIMDAFRLQTRQQVEQGKKFGLQVCEFSEEGDIKRFHEILSTNLWKHGSKPVHSVSELIDLKRRFPEHVHFYGCFKDNHMIGGTFMWQYGDRVLHEQNMATDEKYAELRPANVLNHAMIEETISRGLPYFSFGISTEDKGQKLNFGLARFKEGFGAKGYVNSTFTKSYAGQ